MHLQSRILITGGAGFLGSHLCERLVAQGAHVLCLDNFFTGTRLNVEHIAHVDQVRWAEFGPGAVGIGWDMILMGLAEYLSAAGLSIDPKEALAWQLSEEGRDRARVFLRLYRSASSAFEDRRPDAFVLRLIERIGLRRQQVFATHADTVERLRNIAKLSELATASRKVISRGPVSS